MKNLILGLPLLFALLNVPGSVAKTQNSLLLAKVDSVSYNTTHGHGCCVSVKRTYFANGTIMCQKVEARAARRYQLYTVAFSNPVLDNGYFCYKASLDDQLAIVRKSHQAKGQPDPHLNKVRHKKLIWRKKRKKASVFLDTPAF